MKFWLSAIMLLVTPPVFSLSTSGDVGLDELKSRLSFYSTIEGFETHFEQVKFIVSLNIRLKSKGVLTVKKPHSVLWKISEPSPITVKIDEHQMEITTGSGKDSERQILDLNGVPSTMKNMAVLTTWLKVDPIELDKNYHIRRKAEFEFVFVPRDLAASLFESFDMILDPKGHLKKLTLLEKSKDSLEITFSKPEVLRGAH